MSALNTVKTCYKRKQEELNKSLIKGMYNSYHHQISTIRVRIYRYNFKKRRKCHTNSRITFMKIQLVSIRKRGNSFNHLSQTPTVPMQIFPSNFKESSGKDQHIKSKMR